jgi:hypothetical protein
VEEAAGQEGQERKNHQATRERRWLAGRQHRRGRCGGVTHRGNGHEWGVMEAEAIGSYPPTPPPYPQPSPPIQLELGEGDEDREGGGSVAVTVAV